MKKQSIAVSVALLVLLSITAMASTGRNDMQIQQAVSQKMLASQQLANVSPSVEDGIVTLSGKVNLYQDKLEAAKKARRIAHVAGVRNNITVVGKSVADTELERQLAKKVVYDRVGYFDNAFNYITVSVKDGVATLGGATYWDVPRDDAMAIAARMPGVKEVVDNVKVLPTSTFDDSIRVSTARAIYRDTVLSRYASDPARPIRIVVSNGHVTLYGAVQNEMDKTLAGMRANGVPGAFSVENKLVVD